MQQLFRILSVATMLTAIGACGGGGGDTPAALEPADKYVGEWQSTCESVSGESGETRRFNITFIKTSATAFRGVATQRKFAANNCTGSITQESQAQNDLVIQGTKVIGADTVDKIIGGVDGEPQSKSVSLVKDNKIFSGDQGSPLDGEGFPSAIEPDESLTRVR